MPSSPSNHDNLTIKQQREARRAAKVAVLKKQQATEKRNRLIGIIAASVGAAAVLGLVITVVVTSSVPKADPASIEIEGLKTFDNINPGHVDPNPVDYEAKYGMNPPAGGEHWGAWLNCGVYSEPQQNENATHSLEHGAVWVTYDPELVDEAGVQKLRDSIPNTYTLLTPYPGLPAPVVASAWGQQVQLDGVDDERLGAFIDKFWKSPNVPEPGSACTGALDGPGKVA